MANLRESSSKKMEENKSCTSQYCSQCDLCKAETFHPVNPRWYVKCIPWVFGVFVVIFATATLIVTGLFVAIKYKIIDLDKIYGKGPNMTGYPGIIMPPGGDVSDNLKMVIFVHDPKTASEANKTVRRHGPDMQLVILRNSDEESYFIKEAQKYSNHPKSKGQFLTGHRVDMRRSWVTLGKIYIDGYTRSEMWSPSVKDRNNSFRCSALSRQNDLRMINVPCEFSMSDEFCLICETSKNCPQNSKGHCYKTLYDAIHGIENARRRCGSLDIKGNLAVPYDENVWAEITKAFAEADSAGKCETALLDPMYTPVYESILGTGPTYTLTQIDTRQGTMGEQCVVTHALGGYFILASCSKPMGYAYFNGNHLPPGGSYGTYRPTIDVAKLSSTTPSPGISVPPSLGNLTFVDMSMGVNQTISFVKGKGKLIVVTNSAEERYLLQKSTLLAMYSPAKGKYFIGQRITDYSWTTTTKKRLPSFSISQMWHRDVRTRSSADRCCALSRKHDYKLINIPCEYGASLKMCFACQSESKCPPKEKPGVCYKIMRDRTDGWKMANAQCNHPNIKGTLAVPYDESKLELIKQQLIMEDNSNSCELLLLEPKYDPQFVRVGEESKTTYTLREIDTSSWKMGNQCVVTGGGDHFELVDCNEPHCFAYIDNGFSSGTDIKFQTMIFAPDFQLPQDAVKDGLTRGRGLVELYSIDEETKFFAEAKKHRNDPVSKGKYLIGQRVDIARSWRTNDGIYIKGYIENDMWHPVVENRNNSDRCTAMRRSHDYRVINFACEFAKNDRLCFVCETTFNCTPDSPKPCYKTFSDVVNGVEMARRRCSDLKVKGRLAVPRDEATWEQIKTAHKKADSGGKYEYALLDGMYVPVYQTLGDRKPTYNMRKVDTYAGKMSDRCLVTSAEGDYFILANCAVENCYVYFYGSVKETTSPTGNVTTAGQTKNPGGATTETAVATTEYVIPASLRKIELIDERMSIDDAAKFVRNLSPNFKLVEINNLYEEEYLLREAKKREKNSPCYGVYFTGHRISSHSWTTQSGEKFPSFEISNLWHPETRTRSGADRCCALSAKHDYKLVNVPCEFQNDDKKIWFACQTEVDCPPDSSTCYKIFTDVTHGLKMATAVCTHPKIDGSLAVPYDEKSLEYIKREWIKVDQSKSSELLLLDPEYVWNFVTSEGEKGNNFYALKNIDLHNWTMGELCVVTYSDYFGLADCSKPHGFIYFNASSAEEYESQEQTTYEESEGSSETSESSESGSTSTLEITEGPEQPSFRDFYCVESKLTAEGARANISSWPGLVLVEMFKKMDEEEILRRIDSEGYCGGEYLVGHRVDLDYSWLSEQGDDIAGYSKLDAWSSETEDGNNSNRCAGLSKEHNYEIINVPCSFPKNENICYICETNDDCLPGEELPCYTTHLDFVYGFKMGDFLCEHKLIRGRLAIPHDKAVWIKIKEQHLLADKLKRCDVAYLNIRYTPLYESFRENGSTYTLSIIDYTAGIMSDHCVATRGSDYFVLTSCEKPHCYCVANITQYNNLEYKVDESTEPLTGPAIEDPGLVRGLTFVDTPMNKSSAENYCTEQGPGMKLLQVYSQQEEEFVLAEAKKQAMNNCEGMFLTAYVDIMIWLGSSDRNPDTIIPNDITSAITSISVKDAKYSDYCSALSKYHDYKIIPFPCDFPHNDEICFICETHHNCNDENGRPCYRTFFEPINGQLMAQDRCFHLSPRGRLAEPLDEESWKTLTEVYRADDASGRCELALIGPTFYDGYQLISRKPHLITLIDLSEKTLEESCVVTTKHKYTTVSCDEEHCFVYFNDTDTQPGTERQSRRKIAFHPQFNKFRRG